MATIFISVDIESDGPVPGPYSMLQLGAAAITEEGGGKVIGSFSSNLKELPGATRDPDTMAFWSKHAEQFIATRTNMEDPKDATVRFVDWIDMIKEGKDKNILFVAYPAAFDGMWIKWYAQVFADRTILNRFVDIASYASGKFNVSPREANKHTLSRYMPNQPHTHNALDDAVEQGLFFINLYSHDESEQ